MVFLAHESERDSQKEMLAGSERGRKTTGLGRGRDLFYKQGFGFFDHSWFCKTSGLMREELVPQREKDPSTKSQSMKQQEWNQKSYL